MNTDNLPNISGEEEPEVVVRARDELRRLRRIGVGGFLALVVVLIVLGFVGFAPFFLLPIVFWGFLALLGYEFFPLGRDASWARRVLKRWEEIRVDGAFDQLGAARDPRLESAGAMAGRIMADASADSHTKDVVELVMRRLRSALDDLRMLDLAEQAGGGNRTHQPDPDLHTLLEARIAGLTGALADVYRASLARDEGRVRRLVGQLEDLTHRLEAETDLEMFLESGPDR